MKQFDFPTRLLLVICVLFLLAACSNDEAEELEEPPNIFLLAGDERVSAYDMTSCWPQQENGTVDTSEYDDLVEICADDAPPDFTEAERVELSVDEPIRFGLEEPVPDRVDMVLSGAEGIHSLAADNEISIEENVVTWEGTLVEGEYVLAVLGFWREIGGATYYFPVSIK